MGLGTASRALRNAPNVSAATRQRVLEVAEQHAYVVSPEASRLAGRATRRVAVVVPHLARWFFGAMLEGIVGYSHTVVYAAIVDPSDRILAHSNPKLDGKPVPRERPEPTLIRVPINPPVEPGATVKLEVALQATVPRGKSNSGSLLSALSGSLVSALSRSLVSAQATAAAAGSLVSALSDSL